MASTTRLRLFNTVVNPAVRVLVRHRPRARLAGAVALLSYRGRVSGRTFTVPVEYARDSAGRYVVVPGQPEDKTWWRNFRTPAAVRLLAAGDEVAGTAAVVTDAGQRREALAVYFRRFPASARTHGVVDVGTLDSAAGQLVVILVTPD